MSKKKKSRKNDKYGKLSKKQMRKAEKKQLKLAREFELAEPATATDVTVVLSLPVTLDKANRLLAIADERQVALDDLLSSTIDAMISALESADVATADPEAPETGDDSDS